MTDEQTINAISAVAMAFLHLAKTLDQSGVISASSLAATLETQARSESANAQSSAIFLSMARALRNPGEIKSLVLH